MRRLLMTWQALLLMLPCAIAQAQTKTISGKVTALSPRNMDEPLIGATVRSLDNAFGTVTDEAGKFNLSLPDSINTLLVSSVGYTTDTVKLRSVQPLNIVLRKTKTLGEVVVSKRRKSTEISMLDPLKTERIGAKELMKAACCNLSESFETTPSVDVAFTDAVSGYKQIQMLGLAGPYTLITRENIPDSRGLASVTGLTFTPGTWIEGMQLSKGTGSVVNGYESVAGQINVELLKPFEEKAPKALFNLYQSTQGRSEGNVVWNKKVNDQVSTNLFLHGKSQWVRIDQHKDGFLDQPLDNQFVGLNRWFYFSPNGLEIQGGIKGTFTNNTGGQVNYKDGIEQIPGNPWGYQMDINRIEGWAKIGKIFTDRPGTSVGLQLSGLSHDQKALYGVRKYNAHQNSFYSNLIFQSIIDNTNHVIKAGASFMADDYKETFNAKPYDRLELVSGVFSEYAYSYLEKLNIVAGIRGDYHNLFGAFVTPRLHVRFAPRELSVFRASVGRAQRTANIFAENIGYMASDRNFVIYNTNTITPYGLQQEIAWNFGLNFTQKFQLNYRDGAFSTDFYHTRFQNQVVVDIEDPYNVKFYNLQGESFSNSFQAQLDYEIIRKLDLRLAYRWYDTRTTYGGVLKYRPLVAVHRAFANVAYETKNNWQFDYTVHWTGPKRIPVTAAGHHGMINGENYSPDFTQMNVQVTKTWKDVFDVYVGVENLTNYRQHHPVLNADNPYSPGFDASLIWGPMMGSNIYAGLRYRLN
jgi:hypothetical protein